MKLTKLRTRALRPALVAFVAVFGLPGAWSAAKAQSAQLRQSTAGYFMGKIAGYANGRLTVVTDDGSVFRAMIGPATKIELLKPATLKDIDEGNYIASAGHEKDNDTVEAIELRIVNQALPGLGEGYRPFLGIDGENATMINARVISVTATDGAPPSVLVRVRGKDKTVILPKDAPITFQSVGDVTALVPDTPVSLLTVRARYGKTEVVRINVALNGAKLIY